MLRFEFNFDVHALDWERIHEIMDFGEVLCGEVEKKFGVEVTDSGFGFGVRDYGGLCEDESTVTPMFDYLKARCAETNFPVPECLTFAVAGSETI